MYESISKIYKGMLFMFFDINIFIDIIPDSIGVFMIASACKSLYESYGHDYFKWAQLLFALLVPFAAVNDFYTLGLEYSIIGYMYAIAHGVLFSLGLVYLFLGLTPYLKDFSFGKVKLLVVLNLTMTFMMTFKEFISQSYFGTGLVIISIFGLLATILVILEIRLLKKQLEIQ